jgi:hypothetical protein
MLLCARRRRNHHTTLALARADRCRAWLSNGRAVIGQWLRGLLEQRGLGGARWPWAERPQRAEAPPAEGSSQPARFFRSHVCTGVGTQARPSAPRHRLLAPSAPGSQAPRHGAGSTAPFHGCQALRIARPPPTLAHRAVEARCTPATQAAGATGGQGWLARCTPALPSQ